MKVPYRWISDLVNTNRQGPEELARTLTLLGLEAEVSEGLACTFDGVIAVKVESVTPRDKGSVVELSAGSRRWTVYSTAPGIAAGQVVAFAPPGSTINNEPITEFVFGEVTSEGMVCSAQELGVGRESCDLLELPCIEPGTELKPLLFDDQPLLIEYPSNRGDVLSLEGVARELAAHFGGDPATFELSAPQEVIQGERPEFVQHEGIRISLHDLDLCPRYAARIITDVQVDDSPPELLARLTSLGLKPINNIVDITNIVLMELGQPLHPFDLDTLAGQQIIVRRAEANEKLTTLDGVERSFTPADLFIADENGPIALAGIMGGKPTEVSWKTTRVLLESARFDRVGVRRTARRQALRTDASLHFERGVDPSLVERALDRVAWYVEKYGIGTVSPVTLSAGVPDPAPRQIVGDLSRIGRILGADISAEQATGILQRLGFEVVSERGQYVELTVPSWRADINLGEDLAEEVARHYGYNNIPIDLPYAPMKGMVLPPTDRRRFEVKHTLAAMGYRELMTFPLGNERVGEIPNPLHPGGRPITLSNALSLEQSVMATGLLPGFLAALRHNSRNRMHLSHAMEINKAYWREDGVPAESDELVVMVAREMGSRSEELAFLELKGTIEALFGRLHIASQFAPDDTNTPPYAPGMVARWHVGEAHGPDGEGPHKAHGFIGVIDAAIVASWDVPLVVAYAQFPWEAIWRAAEAGSRAIHFTPLARFPAVDRDLALVVPEQVRYGQLASTIEQHGGEYLTQVGLFDVFRGKQIPKDHKSLAIALKFQDPNGTLTDETVNAAVEAILGAAKKEFGAELRG